MTDPQSLTYIIDTPAYDKKFGGLCALHYLAHALGKLSKNKVYLTTGLTNPRWSGNGIDRDTPFFLGDDNSFKSHFYKWLTALKRYVIFSTFKRKITRLQARLFPDLLWRHFNQERTVVIYGETIIGNPLKASNVVRWIMNTPGVSGGDGVYQLTDHIFQYHPWFEVDKRYQVRGPLTAIDLDYQLSTYKNKNLPDRKGGAYIIRKGRDKKHNQHPADFVCADQLLEKMSDEEAADFFNSIETFISYDDMTFISIQAALCGCNSIIIPGEGDRSMENLKKVNQINGVAYGFEDEEWVQSTASLLRAQFEAVNAENLATIKGFYEYCEKTIPGNKVIEGR